MKQIISVFKFTLLNKMRLPDNQKASSDSDSESNDLAFYQSFTKMSAKSVIYVSRKLSFSGEVLPGCQVICLQVFSGVKLEALLMVS